MIFVDTSALYAVLDRDDEAHRRAHSTWVKLLTTTDGDKLITSNYVLVESFALIQARLGIAAVQGFQDEMLPVLHVEWVNQAEHMVAAQTVITANRRGLSLVDCTSFGVMRRLGVQRIFCFDGHFTEQGFNVLPS